MRLDIGNKKLNLRALERVSNFFWQESSNLVSHKTTIPSGDWLTFSQQRSDNQPAKTGISNTGI